MTMLKMTRDTKVTIGELIGIAGRLTGNDLLLAELITEAAGCEGSAARAEMQRAIAEARGLLPELRSRITTELRIARLHGASIRELAGKLGVDTHEIRRELDAMRDAELVTFRCPAPHQPYRWLLSNARV